MADASSGRLRWMAPALGAGAGEAVTDGAAVGCQIAHQAKRAEAPSRVAAQVDDQAAAILEGRDCTVDVVGDVDSDETGEDVDLEVADAFRKRMVDDRSGQSERLARFRVGYLKPDLGIVAVALGDSEADAAADSELRGLRGLDGLSVY